MVAQTRNFSTLRLRQRDCFEFKPSSGYITRVCPTQTNKTKPGKLAWICETFHFCALPALSFALTSMLPFTIFPLGTYEAVWKGSYHFSLFFPLMEIFSHTCVNTWGKQVCSLFTMVQPTTLTCIGPNQQRSHLNNILNSTQLKYGTWVFSKIYF